MLFLGRIDYTIGYPTEARYFANTHPEQTDYLFYPIEENTIRFTLGYVGCPKTKWGEEVIENVNEILKDHRQTKEFLSFYENWLDDSSKLLHESIVNAYFESE